jgi:hypothetical protein
MASLTLDCDERAAIEYEVRGITRVALGEDDLPRREGALAHTRVGAEVH